MKIHSRESESRRRKKKLGRRVYKKHSTKEIVENIFQNEIKLTSKLQKNSHKIRKINKILDTLKELKVPYISFMSKRDEMKKRIAEKQGVLTAYSTKVNLFFHKVHMLNKIIKEKTMNKENGLQKGHEEKIKLPCLLLTLSNFLNEDLEKNANFIVRENNDNNRVCLMSDEEFNLYTEMDMIQKYLRTEMITKGQVNLKGIDSEINDYIIKNKLLDEFLKGDPKAILGDKFQNNIDNDHNQETIESLTDKPSIRKED